MTRKAPIRTCIACGAQGDKRALVRIVRTPEGEVRVDDSGKLPGRGAYLCLDEACFDKARAKRLIEARLRTKVSAETYEQLEQDFLSLCAGAQVSSRERE